MITITLFVNEKKYDIITLQMFDVKNVLMITRRKNMKKISESEFNEIIGSVADNMREVSDYSIYGLSVEVTFKSNSGKSSWNAFFNFDKDEIEGNLRCNSPYPEASVLRVFGDNVLDRINDLLSN